MKKKNILTFNCYETASLDSYHYEACDLEMYIVEKNQWF